MRPAAHEMEFEVRLGHACLVEGGPQRGGRGLGRQAEHPPMTTMPLRASTDAICHLPLAAHRSATGRASAASIRSRATVIVPVVSGTAIRTTTAATATRVRPWNSPIRSLDSWAAPRIPYTRNTMAPVATMAATLVAKSSADSLAS